MKRLDTFCTTIDHRFEAFWVLRVYEIDQSRVHPSSSFDGVQSTDDQIDCDILSLSNRMQYRRYRKLTLHVILVSFVLYLAEIWRDFNAWHAPHDKFCGHCSFGFTDVFRSKKDQLGRF